MSLLTSIRRSAIVVFTFIALICNVLLSLNTLFVYRGAELWEGNLWLMSHAGAYSALLVALGILANIFHFPRVLRVLGVGLLLFVGWQVVKHIWSSWVGDVSGGISERLMPLPSTFLAGWFGASCVAGGMATLAGQRLWEGLGWFACVVGASTITTHVIKPSLDGGFWYSLHEVGLAGGTCIALYGVIMVLMIRTRYTSSRLSSVSVRVAVIGAVMSLLAWFGGLLYHQTNFRNTAISEVQSMNVAIAQWEDTMPGRWVTDVIGNLGDNSLDDINQNVGGLWHLSNEIDALMLVSDAGQLSVELEANGKQRLQKFLEDDDGVSWVNENHASPVAWHFISNETGSGSDAVLSIVHEAYPGTQLLVLMDMSRWLHALSDPVPPHIMLRLLHDGQEIATAAEKDASSRMIALKHRIMLMSDGTPLTLEVWLSSSAMLSTGALLPMFMGLLGLLATYHFACWVSLVRLRKEHAFALEVREQEYHSLFRHSPTAVMYVGPDGIIRELNINAENMLNTGSSDLSGKDFSETVCDLLSWTCLSDEMQNAWHSVMNGEKAHHFHTSSEGNPTRYYHVCIVPVFVDDKASGVFAVFDDITAWTDAQARLGVMERCLEESTNGVVILSITRDYPVLYVNAAFSRMTGYDSDTLIGDTLPLLLDCVPNKRDLVRMRSALRNVRPCSLTLQVCCHNGSSFWCQISLSPVRDADGELTHYIGIMDDISLRRQHEEQLTHQAMHDALTGLPNRAMLMNRLTDTVVHARHHARTVAVLFIDLDEFKPINDTLSHEVGDRLLISVAQRLSEGLRDSDTLARMGGDEFVLVLELGNRDEAEAIALRLLKSLGSHHMIDGWQLYVTASIGIAELDSATIKSPRLLIQRADIAMQQAKHEGRNQYQRFNEELDKQIYRRLTLRNELQVAMDEQLLQLYYQPFSDAQGVVCGYEALLRWHHPDIGWISPEAFIPIAEQTGQIIALGRWVMWQACSDALQLVRKGIMRGRVAVNLSPLQFQFPGFLDEVREVLEEVGLDASWLELELTEGALMRDVDSSVVTLNKLVELGVTAAIDDFGTGFSSLGYLHRLPASKIKLDKTFINAIDGGSCNSAVCKSVIALGRELQRVVLAEGVETREQFDYLVSLGCERFQGYFFARPMPFTELCELLNGAREAPLLVAPAT